MPQRLRTRSAERTDALADVLNLEREAIRAKQPALMQGGRHRPSKL
jgi:hypothetical protein